MHRITLERPAQWRFALSLFIVGFAFMIAANFTPDAMKPNVYGYIVFDTPAEVWSAGFMAASGLVLYGLHINGRWFWSPVIRVAGYALIAMLFSIIAWSAFHSPDGLVLTIWSVLFFIPQALLFLRVAVADMVWRFTVGKS